MIYYQRSFLVSNDLQNLELIQMDLITFSLLTLGSFKPVFLELLIINRVASLSNIIL